MGGTEKDWEYELTITEPERVRATIAAAKAPGSPRGLRLAIAKRIRGPK